MAEPAHTSSDVDVTILRERFAELRKRQAAGRVPLILLTLAVIAFFGVFTFMTINGVKGNFSQMAVQKAVSDRLPAVIPLAGAQLQKAAVNALPVYRDLAVERYEKVRPVLAEKTMARLDRIPDESAKMMNEALDASFARVLKRIEPEFNKAFPGLSDAQKQEILSGYFHDMIEARNKTVASHIDAMYTNDMIGVHAALDHFNLPGEEAKASPDELQREFLHSMLVLADYELMNGDVFQVSEPAKTPAPNLEASAR